MPVICNADEVQLEVQLVPADSTKQTLILRGGDNCRKSNHVRILEPGAEHFYCGLALVVALNVLGVAAFLSLLVGFYCLLYTFAENYPWSTRIILTVIGVLFSLPIRLHSLPQSCWLLSEGLCSGFSTKEEIRSIWEKRLLTRRNATLPWKRTSVGDSFETTCLQFF